MNALGVCLANIKAARRRVAQRGEFICPNDYQIFILREPGPGPRSRCFARPLLYLLCALAGRREGASEMQVQAAGTGTTLVLRNPLLWDFCKGFAPTVYARRHNGQGRRRALTRTPPTAAAGRAQRLVPQVFPAYLTLFIRCGRSRSGSNFFITLPFPQTFGGTAGPFRATIRAGSTPPRVGCCYGGGGAVVTIDKIGYGGTGIDMILMPICSAATIWGRSRRKV